MRQNQTFVVEWYNHKIYSVQGSEQSSLYVLVPEWWKTELETSAKLGVPLPCVFYYHKTDALQSSPHVQYILWAVAESEVPVFYFFAFLDAAYQGLPYSRTPDGRVHGEREREKCQVNDKPAQGQLVKLPNRICAVIDGMCVAWLVNGTRSSAELSVMALSSINTLDCKNSVAKYWYYD